ncbi:MAG: helix-turn-helix domain-containing protein [Myxococcota bacterium]
MSAKAAATRDVILQAARSCFGDAGFRGSSLRTIAARAGVTQPLINHYFGSKAQLVEAVIDGLLDDYTERQASQWARPLGDLRFFSEGLPILFDWLGENADTLRFAAWARLEGVRLAPSGEHIAQAVRAHIDHHRTTGALRSNVDTDTLMFLIEASFKGYWDRRDVMLRLYAAQAAAIPDAQLRAFDTRYRTLAIDAVLRASFQGPALEAVLALSRERAEYS